MKVGERNIRITAPVDRAILAELRAGDTVSLTGTMLVFRDQVHRRLCEMITDGLPLPFSLKDQVVYYCGPTPARHGMPVGSAGPTTSSRMDPFTEPLLKRGLAAMIGKGNRSEETVEQIRKHHAVYLLATGGTGALIAQRIEAVSMLAFPELGPEAARIFTIRDFPLIVGIDSHGASVFA